MKLGDRAKPDNGFYVNRVTSGPTYGRRCAECKYSFSAYNPVDADTLYWEHIRDEHLGVFGMALALNLVPEDFENLNFEN